MKRVLITIILFAFLLQVGSKLVIISLHEINRDYISKNLCENRNNPQVHCNGSCHLKKQLNEDAGRQHNSSSIKEQQEVTLFSENTAEHQSDRRCCSSRMPPFACTTPHQEFFPFVFHPPAV
jgi:hypothetical protein